MKDFDPHFIPQKQFALVGQKSLVLNSMNELLFLKRSEKSGRGGGWDICGGGLDKYEDPIKGIEREIEEESGLKVKNILPIALTSYNEDGEWVVMIGYQSEALTDKVELSWEHDEYVWKSIDEAKQMDLPEFFQELISKIRIP